MKTFLLLSAALILGPLAAVFGQSPEYEKTYKMRVGIPLQRCDYMGNPDGATIFSKKNASFEIVSMKDTFYVIHFHEFQNAQNQKDSAKKAFNETYAFGADTTADQSANSPIYFQLTQGDFENFCVLAENNVDWSVGAITVPIKVRFNGESESSKRDNRLRSVGSDLNLGTTIGVTWRWMRGGMATSSFQLGLSVTSIDVDSMTTRGRVVDPITASAFTPSLTLQLHVGQYSLGVTGGWDIPGGQLAADWAYRNKPWLGLGIGLNLLSPASTNRQKGNVGGVR
jgi:hypothetical protein